MTPLNEIVDAINRLNAAFARANMQPPNISITVKNPNDWLWLLRERDRYNHRGFNDAHMTTEMKVNNVRLRLQGSRRRKSQTIRRAPTRTFTPMTHINNTLSRTGAPPAVATTVRQSPFTFEASPPKT